MCSLDEKMPATSPIRYDERAKLRLCAATATVPAACFSTEKTDNSFGKHFSSKIGDHDDDDDDELEGAEGEGNERQHAQDVEDLFAGGNRLSMRKFGQKRRSVLFWPLKKYVVFAGAFALTESGGDRRTLIISGHCCAITALYLPFPKVNHHLIMSSLHDQMALQTQEKQHKPPAEGEDRGLVGRRRGRTVRQAAGLHDAPRVRVQPARQQHHPPRLRDFLSVPGEASRSRVLGVEKSNAAEPGESQGLMDVLQTTALLSSAAR